METMETMGEPGYPWISGDPDRPGTYFPGPRKLRIPSFNRTQLKLNSTACRAPVRRRYVST